MNRPFRRASRLLALLLVLAPVSQAIAAAPPARPPISGDAQAAMDRMTSALRALGTFSVTGHTTRDEIVAEGYKLQHNETVSMVVGRPDRMRVEATGDLGDRTFVYDGRQLAIHSVQDRAYVRVAAPPTLEVLLGNALAAGIEMPLVDVVYHAVSGTLLDGVRGGALVGDSTVEGVACQQLAFRQGEVDWQVWIEKGERALPRRIVVTTRHELGQPQFQATLDWNLKPRITPATFKFDPPAGSVELEFESAVPLDGGNPEGDE